MIDCPACGHHFDPHITARRNIDLEHLQDVANTYTRNLHTGKPTLAVELAYQTSHRTAARWVAMARDAGLLGPGHQGRAG